MRTSEIIMSIDSDLRRKWDITSAPRGDDYIKFILDMANMIVEFIDLDDLKENFEKIYKELEDYNFHMANHAIEMVVNLDRYSGRS